MTAGIERVKPLLLLDVDGVLAPFGRQEGSIWVEDEAICYLPRNAGLLATLSEHFELAWATLWEHAANEVIAPLHGLPMLPVIKFFDEPRDTRTPIKLRPIQEFVEDRSFAWVDDEIPLAAHSWVDRRGVPAMLAETDPSVGLSEGITERLVFLRPQGRGPRVGYPWPLGSITALVRSELEPWLAARGHAPRHAHGFRRLRLDRSGHAVTPVAVGGMKGHPVSWPEIAAMGTGLVVEEVNDLIAATEPLPPLVAEIVIKRELRHPAGQQQKADLPCGDQMNPALGRLALDEVVVEPDPQLALVGNHAAEGVLDRASILPDLLFAAYGHTFLLAIRFRP